MAFDISTAKPASSGGFDISTAKPVEPVALSSDEDSTGVGGDIVSGAAEFSAGVNRGVASLIDFFGVDTANAIISGGPKAINEALKFSGIDAEIPVIENAIPRLTETIPGIQGGFVDEGLTKNILSAAGETIPLAIGVGGAIRQSAKLLPAAASKAGVIGGAKESGQIALREAAKTGLGSDVALGAVSAAGGEVGRDIAGQEGQLVGALLAPVAATSGVQAIRGLMNIGGSGIKALVNSVEGMSDDGASKLLAEAMVREGISPDDIAQRLAALGPDAIPADLGNNFSRLLKAASNQVPRIEGRAADVLNKRQAGQSGRLIDAFADSTGTPLLNVDDEIIRLNKSLKPQIDDAYSNARVQGEKVLFPEQPKLPTGVGSEVGIGKATGKTVQKDKTRLEKLLDGVNVSGSAKKSADRELAGKRLSGEEVTKIDIIDANKRALDDQIGAAYRKGESNKARNLVVLKNKLLDEVDRLVPAYKEARSLFAGKAELESAADLGGQFFKLKPRDVKDAVSRMGDSEKKMFKLGAKQAIIDKTDSINITSDSVKRMFGKGGDIKKLSSVFDDPDQFSDFSKAMERESAFALTRRAAQGGSSTTKQLSDVSDFQNVVDDTRAIMGDPLAVSNKLGEILGGLAKSKTDKAYAQALEDAGDILLTAGMNPENVISIIKRGNAKQIENSIKRSVDRFASQSNIVAPSTRAALSSELQQQ